MIFRTVTGQVGIVADGSYTPAAPETDIGLWIDHIGDSHIAIECDLDLGIAGQTLQLSIPRQALAAAIRSLSPVIRHQVGDVVIDTQSAATGVVRTVLDDDVYEVYVQSLGAYRRQGAYLVRPRVMEDGQ